MHKNFETRSRVAARTENGRYSGLGVNGCPLEGTWQQMSPPRLRAGSVKLAAGPRALRFQTGPTRAPRSPEGLPGVSGRAGEPARPQPTSPRISHPGHLGTLGHHLRTFGARFSSKNTIFPLFCFNCYKRILLQEQVMLLHISSNLMDHLVSLKEFFSIIGP